MIKQRVGLLFCLFLFSSLSNAELRDPTRPEGVVPAHSAGALVLNAIIISKDNRAAVINGRIMHVGDFFLTVQVVSIEPNKVELIGPDGKISLVLLGAPIKRAISDHN